MSTPAALMASGGLDSTVLAYWLIERGFEVTPIFISYGQHSAEREYTTLLSVLPTELVSRLRILNLESIFQLSTSRMIREPNLWKDRVSSAEIILPYRNVVLLSAAAAFSASVGITYLFSAFINSNHATEIDATQVFLDQLNLLLSTTGGVSIEMPFRHMSKADVARVGLQLGAPITRTYSCQLNSQAHCGACPNCIDRLDALSAL